MHGGQQLSLWNAHYDNRCFLPIHIYEATTGKPVAVILRPGKTPDGAEVALVLRHVISRIRARWPKVEILLRADSHYAGPEVFDWCRAIFGLAPNAALCRHVTMLEASAAARFKAAPGRGKVRRFAQFYDAAQSWRRVERLIARVEAGPAGTDTRFIVTNLEGGRARIGRPAPYR